MDIHLYHRLHDRSIIMRKMIHAPTSNLSSYTVGFILSVGLTLGAYVIVDTHTMSGHMVYEHHRVVMAIMTFALLQLLVQVVFFLHLGTEKKPRWNSVAFLFMLLTVLIIDIGSLWIMDNLNRHMMNEHDMNQHMYEQSQKGF